MADHPYRRAITLIAPTVATSALLGTLIWKGSNQNPDAAATALKILGGVYLGAGAVGGVVLVFRAIRELDMSITHVYAGGRLSRRRVLWLAALAPVVLWLALNVSAEAKLAIIGVTAVIVGTVLSGLVTFWSATDLREGTKECPDCREDVQRDANVCHYCTYRWHPTNWRQPEPSPYAALRSLPRPFRWLMRWNYDKTPIKVMRVPLEANPSQFELRELEAALRTADQWPIRVRNGDRSLEFRTKATYFASGVQRAAARAWGEHRADQVLGDWRVWDDTQVVDVATLSRPEHEDCCYWPGEPRYG